ncbi:MAG: DEAD/DEAH box helicase [Tepidisphaera sp.]|nr:DEAD/DEAH box helicase [Tepidisphaera sp.]
MMSFAELNLASPIAESLRQEGYTIPTPIQAQTIPPILLGKDVLGCAQTGTGKTAAFALPLLHNLLTQQPDPARRGPVLPRVLVLSPTRELATQIADSFATYGRHTGLSLTAIFGGVSQFHQVRALHRGVDILVATPGRLMDLMGQGLVNLTHVKTLVLDEADRMLDMGFIAPIRKIAAAIPAQRQTLMFSATMPAPIMQLANSLLRDPVKVAVTPVASAAPLIDQSVYMVPRQQKRALLVHFLRQPGTDRAVVFTRTKHGAEKLMKSLVRQGVSAQAIHGNKGQGQRQRALDAFRSGRAQALIATDVAARGLDVDGVTHVFNFELPDDPDSYVHRIGRTGRAGATGIAISFVDHDERVLLRDVERLTGKRIPLVTQLPELPELEREHPEPREGERDRGDRAPRSGHPHPRAGQHNNTNPRSSHPRSAPQHNTSYNTSHPAPRTPAPSEGWNEPRGNRNASLPGTGGNRPRHGPPAKPGHRGGPPRLTLADLDGTAPTPQSHTQKSHAPKPHGHQGGHRAASPHPRANTPKHKGAKPDHGSHSGSNAGGRGGSTQHRGQRSGHRGQR